MSHTRNEDLDMMRQFTRWTRDNGYRRALPLVRGSGGFLSQDQGFLIKEKEKSFVEPTVYVGNVFLWAMGQPIQRTIVYDSFEKLYDDGWRVD